VKYSYNRRLTANWDFHFFTFVSEVQLQLKTNCELGSPFLHACEWSTITTEDSLWTGISISSRLCVKYSYNWPLILAWDFHFFTFVSEVNYNWKLIVNWDFHFFTFVSEVQLQLTAHCDLGSPFLHACEWSTITTEDSLWTGISISSRLCVKYSYNWPLILDWDFRFLTFMSEVQLLQPPAHCDVSFTLVVRVFERVLLPWAQHLLQTPCGATPVFVPPSCITCCVTYNALWTIIAGFLPPCN